MGEGARGGRSALSVAERRFVRGERVTGVTSGIEVVGAEEPNTLGGEEVRAGGVGGFTGIGGRPKAPPRERRLKTPTPRSFCMTLVGGDVEVAAGGKRAGRVPARLARRACFAMGVSEVADASSSRAERGPRAPNEYPRVPLPVEAGAPGLVPAVARSRLKKGDVGDVPADGGATCGIDMLSVGLGGVRTGEPSEEEDE